MKNKLEIWTLVGSAVALFALISPKWTYAPAAWFAAAPLLLLLNKFNPGRAMIVAWSILFLSGLISQYKVMPFPTFVYVIMVAWLSLLGTTPYFLNKLLTKGSKSWLATLAFPVLSVSLEYVTSFQGSGTWGSIAYTQMNQVEFVQLASVTGIWGLTFMISWFSSLVAWMAQRQFEWVVIRTPATFFGVFMAMITVYGSVRLTPYFRRTTPTVRVSGISLLNLQPMQIMYEEAFGKSVKIDVSTLSYASPELQEINKGLAAWVETSTSKTFARTAEALDRLDDQLFREAEISANAGAKIISFSEAQMITLKPDENKILKKGQQFAKHHKVHLILSLASFFPGKIEYGKPFYENKLVVIDNMGSIAHQFYKNKPVPLVEGSKAGDGNVPVFSTPYGRVALSICYDADFPQLIKQAGKKNADILFLPSGDWKEISPYHADMARLRAIENGFALVRPVSNATSIACDNWGKLLTSQRFSPSKVNSMIVDVPVKHINTAYNVVSDTFALLCLSVSVIWILARVVKFKIKPGLSLKATGLH